MKIGIVGAGRIGATVARLFVQAGHRVAVSNSRGADTLMGLVEQLGPSQAEAAGTVDDAARFGDVVLLAVPWSEPDALPRPESVAGKIVIDAMNPYRPEGGLYDLGESTSSEEVLKRIPGARLVKAFNTIYFEHLATRGWPGAPLEERHVIFLAGDDERAKQVVARLIEEIGFGPLDTGSLHEGGRRQEPGSAIYNKPMTLAEARRVLGQPA